MLPIHQHILRVQAYETDFRNRWKPHCLQNSLQEAASLHAAELGFGYLEMGARGLAWILSRMRIDFYHMPTMGEEIVLRTWPKGIQQRLFFTRDFRLETPGGLPVALATSAWVLVDLAKRRILPPTALPGDLPIHAEDAIPDLLEKIVAPEELPPRGEFQAGYTAVDAMGHANSGRYLEWLLDCFPFETYRERRLARVQFNFSTEVKPGERLSIAAGEGLARGTILESGVRAFDAAFSWASVDYEVEAEK